MRAADAAALKPLNVWFPNERQATMTLGGALAMNEREISDLVNQLAERTHQGVDQPKGGRTRATTWLGTGGEVVACEVGEGGRVSHGDPSETGSFPKTG